MNSDFTRSLPHPTGLYASRCFHGLYLQAGAGLGLSGRVFAQHGRGLGFHLCKKKNLHNGWGLGGLSGTFQICQCQRRRHCLSPELPDPLPSSSTARNILTSWQNNSQWDSIPAWVLLPQNIQTVTTEDVSRRLAATPPPPTRFSFGIEYF